MQVFYYAFPIYTVSTVLNRVWLFISCRKLQSKDDLFFYRRKYTSKILYCIYVETIFSALTLCKLVEASLTTKWLSHESSSRSSRYTLACSIIISRFDIFPQRRLVILLCPYVFFYYLLLPSLYYGTYFASNTIKSWYYAFIKNCGCSPLKFLQF